MQHFYFLRCRSASERAETDANLRSKRGETTVLVFSMQARLCHAVDLVQLQLPSGGILPGIHILSLALDACGVTTGPARCVMRR